MLHWKLKFALPAMVVLALTGACTTNGQSDTTGVSDVSSAPATEVPSQVDTSTPVLVRAACGTTPPAGSYDFQDRTKPGQPIRHVVINHTTIDCGNTFTEFVDFTQLGNWPSCSSDPTAADNLRRPCKEPFKQQPDQRSLTLSGWAPTEGQDSLMVECQMPSNTVLGQGTLRNAQMTASSIWNKVRDERIPGTVGWINDIWMGNGGFRGKLCGPQDAYDPAK